MLYSVSPSIITIRRYVRFEIRVYMHVLYTVLFLLFSSSVALSGLVIIGRLHRCVRASRGFPNRKLLGLKLLRAAGKHFVAEFIGETL